MSFTDIVHHVAQIGQHVVEFVDGQRTVTIDNVTLSEQEVIDFITHLTEAASKLGLGA